MYSSRRWASSGGTPNASAPLSPVRSYRERDRHILWSEGKRRGWQRERLLVRWPGVSWDLNSRRAASSVTQRRGLGFLALTIRALIFAGRLPCGADAGFSTAATSCCRSSADATCSSVAGRQPVTRCRSADTGHRRGRTPVSGKTTAPGPPSVGDRTGPRSPCRPEVHWRYHAGPASRRLLRATTIVAFDLRQRRQSLLAEQ